MRGFTFFIAIFFISALSAQQKVRFENVSVHNGLIYIAGQAQPFTGDLVDYYVDGSRKSISNVVKGKFSGTETTYFDSGIQRSTCKFKDNVPVGKLKVFNEDGQLVFFGRYYKGLLYRVGEDVPFSGTIENYYINGQKVGQTNYKDGMVNGEQAWWTRDGHAICEYVFMNNVIVETRNYIVSNKM